MDRKLTPFPLAILENGQDIEPHDGYIHALPEYCRKNCNSKKCREEYQSLKDFEEKPKFKECHKGFLLCYMEWENKKIVFNGLIDSQDSDKNQKIFGKKFKSNKIDKRNILDFVSSYKFIDQLYIREKLKKLIQPYHDIKRLIGAVVTNLEAVAHKDSSEPRIRDIAQNLKHIAPGLDTVYYTCQFIHFCTTQTDSFNNPQTLKSGRTIPRGIYKSFDKMKRILLSKAKEKNLELKFEGESYRTIQAYSSLDLLPFTLLDNAIKYSLEDNEVLVKFEEGENSLVVSIENIGPFVSNEEKEKIFKKFARGNNANKFAPQGSGIGLYLAKIIAEHHGATIEFFSQEKEDFRKNGQSIANNTVKLSFKLN